MTLATIVVPAFNVSRTLHATLDALFAQTYDHFEIVLVNDGSTDDTLAVARSFAGDPRMRIITQPNRGLAGARNTGIAHAHGRYIGFCDADDLWAPHKLESHVSHLLRQPNVGVSFAGSVLIDDNGRHLGHNQRPRLRGITAAHILKRNPIGNGSAPVIRSAVFDAIAYRPAQEQSRDWYFDETFRQSEDVECWMRIALTTQWDFEGIPGLLTKYRISAGGLSAATERQLASWERMITKLKPLAPALYAAHVDAARAYQLRYLCRRAVSDLDAKRAKVLVAQWLRCSFRPLIEEPIKSVVTLAAVGFLSLVGAKTINGLMALKTGQRT
jgi:glycosyltransferase involved in cell wall biosynthesis